MRYYKILITGIANSQTTSRTYTSLTSSGAFNPGALDISLELIVVGFSASGVGQSYVQIRGVPILDVAQASNFSKATIQIYGGMSKGLPLANPSQQGLLIQGTIWQAFGNWVGAEMSLDFYIAPLLGVGPSAGPPNIVFRWPAKTALADALTSTLTTAFPSMSVSVQLTDNLVQNHDEVGFYPTLTSFAEMIQELTTGIVKDQGYRGVQIIATGSKIVVFDQPTTSAITQIAFTDLVGQPTWLNYGEIQLQCVMRGDLQVGGRIRLPLGNTVVLPSGSGGTQTINALSLYGTINTPSSGPGPSRVQQAGVGPNGLIFQGDYIISSLRHLGDFRSPDGAAWVTVINAVPAPSATNT